MGRGGSGSIITALAREAVRQQRVAEANLKRKLREEERQGRELMKQSIIDEKTEKQRYIQSRIDEVDE